MDSLCLMLLVINYYKEALQRYNQTMNVFDLNDLLSAINMILILAPKYNKNCIAKKHPIYLTVQRFYRLALKQKETIEGIKKARKLHL